MDISLAQLQAALISIDADTDGLNDKVRALEDNGLTLAECLVKIASEQGPPRKPISRAETPPICTTAQKKAG
jgi:hypothetical protein